MSQTRTTMGVVSEPGFLASWALTMESRLSSQTGIAQALDGQHGHRLVCEARPSLQRKRMMSGLAPRAS